MNTNAFLAVLFVCLAKVEISDQQQAMKKTIVVVMAIVNGIIAAIVIFMSSNVSNPTPRNSHICDITYTEMDVTVSCLGRGLTSVPTTLPVYSTSIDLSNNMLSRITDDSFGCLKHLRLLDLSANEIRYLEKGSFHCLPNLSQLRLSANKFNFSYEALPVGLFSYPKHLKKLVLGGMNPDGNWTYPERTFMDLANLESLKLPAPPVLTFGPAFEKLKFLKEMILDGGDCHHIRNDSFKVFSGMNITTFQIWYTHTEDINILALKAFHNVQSLVIEGLDVGLKSMLKTLYVFTGRNMSLIDFSRYSYSSPKRRTKSHFTVLTPSDTRYLVSICVEKVDFQYNEVSSIQKGTFSHEPFMGCIKYLDLSNNCILVNKDLYMQSQVLRNIEVLNMNMGECTKSIDLYSDVNHVSSSLAKLQSTPEEDDDMWNDPVVRLKLDCHGGVLNIHLPQKLKILNLQSVMYDFKVYNCTFHVYGTESLTHLDVSYWYFYSEESSFAGLENLLFLGYMNNFGRLSSDFVFHNSQNLHTLLLNRASFYTIFEEKKPNFRALTRLFKNLNVLSLTNIGIKEFPFKADELGNLSYIDLSENTISNFDSDTRHGLDKRIQERNLSLDLSGNILTCGCGSLDFVAWMLETDVNFTNWNLYRCMKDDGTVVKLSDFADSYIKQWRKCYSKFWLAFAVSMTLLLITIVAVSIMLDKNSLRLKCLLLQWIGIKWKVPKREDFLYDIFVYYSSKDDHTWVCNTFRQMMEEVKGLRVCIPDRDFVPGACTAEEIVEAIHKSWKTVIFMTDVFLEDELCSFTLSSAVYASTNEMPNRLILLYSNEIFSQPLPPIVTQLLDGDDNFMLEKFEQMEQWDIFYHRVLCLV